MENKEELQKQIDALLKLEKENPEDAGYKAILGYLHLQLGEYEKAIEWYEKVLEITSDSLEAIGNIGISYSRLNKNEEAIENYKKVLSIKPDYIIAMNNIGVSYEALGEYEESIEWYKKALSIKPDYFEAIYNLGISYGESGEYTQSIDWLKKALNIKENYFEAMYSVGISYYYLNEYKKATEWYKKALKIKPDYFATINNLGVLYDDWDKPDEAIEWFEKALKIKPDDYGLIDDLLWLYIKQDKEDKLISLYNDYIKEKNEPKFHIFKFVIACFLKSKNIEHELLYLLNNNMPENYESSIISIINVFANSICVDYLDKFNNTNISKECIDYKEHMIVENIFWETKYFDDKKEKIREYLIKLYKQTIDIKEKLRFKKNINSIEICHYAKLGSIKNIIKKDNNNNKDKYIVDFRLFNVVYMNDPKEGEIFLQLIKNNKKNRKVICKSNTYLGCFSKNTEKLPLWVQYTNNCEGCCLVFPKNIFDKKGDYCFSQSKLYDTAKNNSNNNDNDNNIKDKTQKYVLYNVAYVDKKKNIYVDEKIEESKNIKKLLINIQDLMDKINIEIKDKVYKEKIEIIVNDILDQVRFLFKNKDYEHEQELRVVKFSDNPEVDASCGDVPRLYVKFDRKIKLEKVVLGSRIGKNRDIGLFLDYSKKVKKVSYSGIEYR